MMRFNRTITALKIPGVGGTKEVFSDLFDALTQNIASSITSLDVSNNTIEDKGIFSLSSFFQTTPNNIISLNISNTGSGKQVQTEKNPIFFFFSLNFFFFLS
jgi:hypothetical protein